ncbi:mucin-like protein 1 [Coprinopsis cinerea AmutBmut pab1-1]|nr:mucin-like protein 1 [Coprinopsis cinerea AmutBmut pab1-1]
MKKQKPRRRDRVLKFFGFSSRGSESMALSLPDPKENIVERTPYHVPGKPFKRSQSVEKDMAVLSTIYLLQDSDRLKAVILLIVQISRNDMEGRLSAVLNTCAEFCERLVHLADEGLTRPDDVAESFYRTIEMVRESTAETTPPLLEIVNQSINSLASSHPMLSASRSPRAQHPIFKAALGAGVTVLDIFREASESAGVPGVKAIVGSVLSLFKAAQQTQFNYEDIHSLAFTAGEFALAAAEACSTMGEVSEEVEQLIARFEGKLRPIVEKCRELNHKSVLWCFLQNSNHKRELDGLATELNAAVHQFQNSNLLRLQVRINRIATQIDYVTFNQLPQHPDVSGLRRDYYPGSRQDTIAHISGWLDRSSEPLLWLHGPLGMGKSTLAHHLAQELRKCDRLAASAFLTAVSPDSTGPETLVKILASEIGKVHPRAVSAIVTTIKNCAGLPLQDHLERYIHQPVRSLRYPYPLVILLDALDEWKHYRSFIQLLSHVDPSVVRFIVTSRENALNSALKNLEAVPHQTYALPPISHEVLKSYIEHHFNSIDWGNGGNPDDRYIAKVANKADGLFVWVATVFAILNNILDSATPQQRLEQIMYSQRNVSSAEGLYNLYHDAIVRLFPNPENQEVFRRFFGLTTVLQHTLSLSDFASLSGLTPTMVEGVQALLSALRTRGTFHRDKVQPASCLYHLSFIEFIHAEGSKASPPPFSISHRDCHSLMGERCLELTFHGFLPYPSTAGSLPHPRNYRRYACIHWPLHVSAGTGRRPAEWSQTTHFKLLEGVETNGALDQWAIIVGEILYPNGKLKRTRKSPIMILLRLERMVREQEDGAVTPFVMQCLEMAARLWPDVFQIWRMLVDFHHSRYKKTWDIGHIIAAVDAGSYAIQQCPLSHPERSSLLLHYLQSLWDLHEEIPQPPDAQLAIELAERWLGGLDRDRAYDCDMQELLGAFLYSRFQKQGSVPDLNRAVQMFKEALESTPPSDPCPHIRTKSYLARVLMTRHEYSGSPSDLEEAIIHLFHVGQELGHEHNPTVMLQRHSQAKALLSRFGLYGSISDLEEAIKRCEAVLEICPAPHPVRPTALETLAEALCARGDQYGTISDVEEAIRLTQEALELLPREHPTRFLTLHNLAGALGRRFEHHGSITDLEKAIQLHREVLELQPPSRLKHPELLHAMAASLFRRFLYYRSYSDLVEAIQLFREVLELAPTIQVTRFNCMINLAHSLQVHSKSQDLEEAIQIYRQIMSLYRDQIFHILRPGLPAALARALHDYADLGGRGSISDFNEAIQLQQEALEHIPTGHLFRPRFVTCLGDVLRTRYRVCGSISDLEEALLLHREALESTSDSLHPDRGWILSTIALSFGLHFQHFSSISYLNEAIRLAKEGLELKTSHAVRNELLITLGIALLSRFYLTRSEEDLIEAIVKLRKTLDRVSKELLIHRRILSYLILALGDHFTLTGAVEDQEEAGRLLDQYKQLTGEEGPFNFYVSF